MLKQVVRLFREEFSLSSKLGLFISPIGAASFPLLIYSVLGLGNLDAKGILAYSLVFSFALVLPAYLWGFLGLVFVGLPVLRILKSRERNRGRFFIFSCGILAPVFMQFIILSVYPIFAIYRFEAFNLPFISVFIMAPLRAGSLFNYEVIRNGEIIWNISYFSLFYSLISGILVSSIYWHFYNQKIKKSI